ncbi:hypothetical protein BH11MYX1_BH11MYX1_47180 [soil metagenome]
MTRAWVVVVVAVILAALAIRTLVLVVQIARGERPWTRLLLPAIVLVEAVGKWLYAGSYWQVRLATAVLLELVFVGVAMRELRSTARDQHPLKIRIARALEALVPTRIANLVAFEIVIVAMALRFLSGGWRRAAPAGFTYHRNSGLRFLLPLLPLLAVGDVLLLELVILPHAATWLRILVHALALYGLVWLVGFYASCRAFPHEVRGGVLVAHRGVLGHARIPIAEIESIAALPTFTDDWKKRSYCAGALRLDVPGATVLELRMRAPVLAYGVLGACKTADRVLLAVDEPAALIAELG